MARHSDYSLRDMTKRAFQVACQLYGFKRIPGIENTRYYDLGVDGLECTFVHGKTRRERLSHMMKYRDFILRHRSVRE